MEKRPTSSSSLRLCVLSRLVVAAVEYIKRNFTYSRTSFFCSRVVTDGFPERESKVEIFIRVRTIVVNVETTCDTQKERLKERKKEKVVSILDDIFVPQKRLFYLRRFKNTSYDLTVTTSCTPSTSNECFTRESKRIISMKSCVFLHAAEQRATLFLLFFSFQYIRDRLYSRIRTRKRHGEKKNSVQE